MTPALAELHGARAQKKLPGLAQRLLSETRPFARPLLLSYIEDGCDRPGHRVFVKTVFKAAQKANDVELMGHSALAFDRLVRRRLLPQPRWDWPARRAVTEQVLREPADLLLRLPRWRGRGQRTHPNPLRGVTTRMRRRTATNHRTSGACSRERSPT